MLWRLCWPTGLAQRVVYLALGPSATLLLHLILAKKDQQPCWAIQNDLDNDEAPDDDKLDDVAFSDQTKLSLCDSDSSSRSWPVRDDDNIEYRLVWYLVLSLV